MLAFNKYLTASDPLFQAIRLVLNTRGTKKLEIEHFFGKFSKN